MVFRDGAGRRGVGRLQERNGGRRIGFKTKFFSELALFFGKQESQDYMLRLCFA